MDGGRPAGGHPPYDRERLTEALLQWALEPDKATVVPFNYRLYRLARSHGLAPWVFDGDPPDRPSLLWLIRILEYARMEASVKVSSSG